MAEKKDEFWLDNELNNDQIPIAIDLAVALRADEVEKFLELYDSIPESIQTERIDHIKEMARQLAALPKKQFDMYRTKPRVLGSGEHFNPSLTTSLNVKEKLTLGPVNHFNMNVSIISDCKKDEIGNKWDLSETEKSQVIDTTGKSSKKKMRRKKKNKADCVEEQCGLPNGEITSKNHKESSQKQSVLMENKLLDPDHDSSRIATINRTLVADISAVCSSDSNVTFPNKMPNKNLNDKSQEPKDAYLNLKLKNRIWIKNKKYSDNNEVNDDAAPPFGFPLSANKLIQSAVGLLDNKARAIGTAGRNSENQDIRYNDINIERHNSKIVGVKGEISIENRGSRASMNCIQTDRKFTSKSMDQKHSNKSDNEGENESVDGDISNLSALEDEGWQSQVRRSYRKKKKELTGRVLKERSQTDQKSKSCFQNDHKANNFKNQNSKNTVNNRNQNGTLKEDLKMSTRNDATNDGKALISLSVQNKEEKDKSQEGAKPVYTYRDALLKNMPKVTEELQYNSDSGVEVNSVSSCDSAIHSPQMPYEFDLKEAVNFLTKGCAEVTERDKQGKVQYYSDIPEQHSRKKQYRKGNFSRPKNTK